jgi:uncharacterized membrane protein
MNNPAHLVRMKWTTAVAVGVVLIAPVPVVAGLVAYSITVVHALPWVLRAA